MDIQVVKQAVKEKVGNMGKVPCPCEEGPAGSATTGFIRQFANGSRPDCIHGLADAEDADTANQGGYGAQVPHIMGAAGTYDTIGLNWPASSRTRCCLGDEQPGSASPYLAAGLIESGRRGYKDGQGFCGLVIREGYARRKSRKRGTGTR